MSDIKWCDVTMERLYKENGLWDAEEMVVDGEAVDVLWNDGIVEACSIENLVEVEECLIGI